MKLNLYLTRVYENEPPLPHPAKQTQSKPISKLSAQEAGAVKPPPARLCTSIAFLKAKIVDIAYMRLQSNIKKFGGY
jgi:hypothetical protein